MTMSTRCVRQIIDDEWQLFENSIIIGKFICFRTFCTIYVLFYIEFTYYTVFFFKCYFVYGTDVLSEYFFLLR